MSAVPPLSAASRKWSDINEFNENGIFRHSLPPSAIACEKTRMDAKDCKGLNGR